MVDIEITSGLTIVDAVHDGSSNFQVQLIPTAEGSAYLFVNEIGPYTGETARLLESGTYQLSVKADGDWWLNVQQPRRASGDGLPQSRSDTKPRVVGPFAFSGSHTAACTYTGESNFQVSIFSPDGQFGDLLINTIGRYTGEQPFHCEGIGYVVVKATGDWGLELR